MWFGQRQWKGWEASLHAPVRGPAAGPVRASARDADAPVFSPRSAELMLGVLSLLCLLPLQAMSPEAVFEQWKGIVQVGRGGGGV